MADKKAPTTATTAPAAAASVEAGMRAYLEYTAIVGDADGGVLLSQEEFEKYKARAIEARKHRLYVSWRNTRTGVDCHLVGPATRCFCTHVYRSHATDNWADRNVFCRAKGCRCKRFEYVPVHGTFRIKCRCKHFFDEHRVTEGHKCKHPGCTCDAFYSPMSCSCGDKCDAHTTIIESREERMALGKPVDNIGDGGAGYEALGGITGFGSLIDGADRLDSSARPVTLEPIVTAAAAPPSTSGHLPPLRTSDRSPRPTCPFPPKPVSHMPGRK
jgi:hypothetical protein